MLGQSTQGVCLVLSFAILAACAGPSPAPSPAPSAVVGEAPPPPTREAAPATSASLPVVRQLVIPAAPTVAPAVATSIPSDTPFRRRDAPPDGVPQQIAFGFGNNQGCFKGYYDAHPELGSQPFADPVNEESSWVFEVARQRVNGNDGICFAWLWPDRHIEVTITDPQGAIEQRRVRTDADGFGFLPILGLPGEPIGDYRFVAVQDDLRLEGGWNLIPATRPRLAVTPRGGPPGTVFTLIAAGFSASRRLPVRIYDDIYMTTVEIVLDPVGTGMAHLVTETDAPPGDYVPLVLLADAEGGAPIHSTLPEVLTLTTMRLIPLVPKLPLTALEPAATAPGSDTGESPLQRRGEPPAGVSPQLPLPGGKGPTCAGSFSFNQPSSITLSAANIKVGQKTLACPEGFFPAQLVQYEVLKPDGAVVQGVGDASQGIHWLALPGEPLGMYQLTVTQGDKLASTSFFVAAPTGPNIAVAPPVGPPGSSFFVVMAGFAPGSSVPLHLYYDCDAVTMCFAVELGRVEVDQEGGTVTRITSSTTDPSGWFAVDAQPSSWQRVPGSPAVFVITER